MSKRPVTFSIEKKLANGMGRVGVIQTPHGPIETPAFIAVGTKATVKATTPEQLNRLGLQSLIANTYHLYLQPGEEVVEKAGGVGKFMGWSGPTMTDSGGFQVFSLGEGFGKKISKFTPEEASLEEGVTVFDEDIASQHGKLAIVDDEGVSFTSHLDGSLHRFTPERSIEIQHKLGADIIFAFDEFRAPDAAHRDQKEAMERTHSWAKRSLTAHRGNVRKNAAQGIYGIVQGGRHHDLRKMSAETLAAMDFDGYGIGGTFSKDDLVGTLEIVSKILPEGKPRHLLGIGEPEDLFIAVAAGMDTFDCVAPTRMGRTGQIYTKGGKRDVTSTIYRTNSGPLDDGCACETCITYTAAYVSHLFRAKEMLGATLASIHNLHFIISLLRNIRHSILEGTFEQFRDEFARVYRS